MHECLRPSAGVPSAVAEDGRDVVGEAVLTVSASDERTGVGGVAGGWAGGGTRDALGWVGEEVWGLLIPGEGCAVLSVGEGEEGCEGGEGGDGEGLHLEGVGEVI